MDDLTDEELAALPREELVERARELQIVLRVARAVSTARDVGDLARRFVDAVAAYTRFASVCLFRYVEKEHVFELVAERGFGIESYPPPSSRLPWDGSLTGMAAARRQMVTTDDLANDDRVEPATRAALASSGYVSGTAVPIVHRGEVLGAFNLIYPRGAGLQPRERRLIEALEKTVGLALAQQLAGERERDLETQARRAQQLESLGVFAGGLAHDFNNLLAGMVGALDLARIDARAAGLGATAGLLEEALRAADRATALVRQLLTFSRGGAPSRRRVADIGRVVIDAATFASRGTSVLCVVDAVEPLGLVEADPGQIAQVVQNLALNACQASPPGSTVSVRVTRVAPEVPAGEARLRIEVADQGAGIAPEHVPRIFEPFYTVREGGTGLGLSVSHSILVRHGGTLTVDTTVGRGATFVAEFPVGRPGAEPPAQAASEGRLFEGRALLMDDEAGVRRVGGAMLERLGFDVLQAEHGEAALALVTKAAAELRPVRVAILDLTVPGGMGAVEIAEALRRASPGIRIVLSTGYARMGPVDQASAWDATLAKPYGIDELRGALGGALERR